MRPLRTPLFVTLFILSIMISSARDKLCITIGGRTATATLERNSATERLVALLADGSVTIDMHDYGGFEKVGELPWALPTSNCRLTATPGDIMLYQGDNIVFFHGTNSWSYTPLGRFDNADAAWLKLFFGRGNAGVTLSLPPTDGIEPVAATDPGETLPEVYDVAGRRVDLRGRSLSDLPSGFYIVDGRKQFVGR